MTAPRSEHYPLIDGRCTCGTAIIFDPKAAATVKRRKFASHVHAARKVERAAR